MSCFFLEGRCFDRNWRRGPVRTVEPDVAAVLEGIARVLEEAEHHVRR